MRTNRKERLYSTGERAALFTFWVSSSLFILNILIGKAAILWNWNLFKLGNVGEFLLLLIASISVVAASLHREASDNDRKETRER